MSLEGQLRELGLPEVLQLLGLSRKSGTLQLRAQLRGFAAFITLANGAVIDAAQWRFAGEAGSSSNDAAPDGLAQAPDAMRAVEECVLDLLTWREGDFRFLPMDSPSHGTGVRLAVESLLVASAQRAEGWDRIADRIPHLHVVPAFVDVEPQQLPLLRLVPQEWEILTRVDGKRDLGELARVLGREVLDVAEIVHGLIGAGLLALRETQAAPRQHPTPPIGAPVQAAAPTAPPDWPADEIRSTAPDLWIPNGEDALLSSGGDELEDDSLFDPIELGVITSDGLPRRRTTPFGVAAIGQPDSPSTEIATPDVVATANTETSLLGEETYDAAIGKDAETWCSQGDDAARRGDLPEALACWSAALRTDEALVDADRIREAIALAARLHALLHPAARQVSL